MKKEIDYDLGTFMIEGQEVKLIYKIYIKKGIYGGGISGRIYLPENYPNTEIRKYIEEEEQSNYYQRYINEKPDLFQLDIDYMYNNQFRDDNHAGRIYWMIKDQGKRLDILETMGLYDDDNKDDKMIIREYDNKEEGIFLYLSWLIFQPKSHNIKMTKSEEAAFRGIGRRCLCIAISKLLEDFEGLDARKTYVFLEASGSVTSDEKRENRIKELMKQNVGTIFYLIKQYEVLKLHKPKDILKRYFFELYPNHTFKFYELYLQKLNELRRYQKIYEEEKAKKEDIAASRYRLNILKLEKILEEVYGILPKLSAYPKMDLLVYKAQTDDSALKELIKDETIKSILCWDIARFEENLELIKYYNRNYGFEMIGHKDIGFTFMAGTMDKVINKCIGKNK